ncbi:MAG: hypothetical protein SVU88_02710 [Candidatus Nanohaloarchaea archaeon]|nr:hypothetical protein [Candidatus Nanohaloarchaea archaeon]
MVQTAAVAAFQPIMEATRAFLPSLFFAAVILVVGYIIGRATYAVVNRVLEHTEIDAYFQEEGHLELRLSDLFADLAKWIVYFAFLWQAGQILGVVAINRMLEALVNYIPGVIGAIAVFLAGYGIAIYTKDQVVGAETLYADLIGKTIFFFVLYVAFATALDLARIPTQLLNNILLLLVASGGLAFAIAAGWGLKDVFQDEAERYIDSRR